MAIDNSNIIVHALWIGKKLSPIELLCINSFIAQGHEFHLWLYDDIETVLPVGIKIEDASLIIPASEVFSYSEINQFGHGKGSYAGFSDIFRYKLLYEKGGWWTDMDVVCIKPLDFPDEYVFRTHHDFLTVGNVMKCPQRSDLMKRCFFEAKEKITTGNNDWNLPIRILNNNVVNLGLLHFVKDFTNIDNWNYVKKFILYNAKVNNKWKIIHLVNEDWNKNKIDKKAIPRWSFLGKLLKKYEIKQNAGFLSELKNAFKIIDIKNSFLRTYWFFSRVLWKVIRFFFKLKVNS